MDLATIIALYAAAALNAAVPGPCILLTLGRAAAGGLPAGLRLSAGILAGNLVLLGVALAATYGALTLSDGVFAAMRWAGAGTLLLIAIRMLTARPASDFGPRQAPRHAAAGDGLAGLMVGTLSPFNLLFMLALLPIFLSGHGGLAHNAVPVIVTVLAAVATAQAGATLVGTGALRFAAGGARVLERGCVVSLIGFAVVAMVA